MKRYLLVAVIVFSLSNIMFGQVWQWATSTACTGYNNRVYGMATDAQGNVYAVGSFSATSMTIGQNTLNSNGLEDAYLAKLDPKGNVLWVKQFGGTKSEQLASVALDAQGNIYVLGHFSSPSITFGSVVLNNLTSNSYYYDVMMAKLDSDGNTIWASSFGGGNSEYGNSIAVDTKGNVFVGGYFSSSINIGPITLTSTGSSDIYVARFDLNGNIVWGKKFGGISSDDLYSLTTDKNSNVFITGRFTSNNLSFDGIVLQTISYNYDAYFAKLDSNGQTQWASSAKGAGADYPYSIKVDNSNNVVVCGYFQGTYLAFDTDSLFNYGTSDYFLAKFDNDGNRIWIKNGGAASAIYSNCMAIDSANNIFVGGYFQTSFAFFGKTTLLGTGNGNPFVVKFDTSGTVVWAKNGGGTSIDQFNSLVYNRKGNIVLGGTFNSPNIKYGSITLTSNTTVNVYNAFWVSIKDTVKAICKAEAGDNQSVCKGSQAVLTGSGAALYKWPGSSSFSSNATITITPQVNTTYVLTVTDSKQLCTATDKVIITVLVPNKPNIILNGDTLQSTSANTYQWYDYSTVITGETNQKYLPTTTGDYLVEVTDSKGCKVKSDLFHYIYVGIEENTKDRLIIYPNPASNILEINATLGSVLNVFDIRGKLIKQQNVNNIKTIINIENLPSGVYLLELKNNSINIRSKFIKN